MGTKERKGRRLSRWQIVSIWLMICDMIVAAGAYFGALWLRFDFRFSQIPAAYLQAWRRFTPIYLLFCLLVFLCLRLYRSLWEYASFDELNHILIASAITAVFHAVVIQLVFLRMPISYWLLGAVFQLLGILAARFGHRYLLQLRRRSERYNQMARAKRCMLIGAGAAGQMVLRDINHADKSRDRVVCIVDDDPNKWSRYLDGVKVVGGRDDILSKVQEFRVEKILLAIPSATPEQRRDILDICKETGCELKIMPSILELSEGQGSTSLREVNVEDLLGREPIKVDMREIFTQLSDKVILVTGGGGSIGSELCRQIAGHNPRQLIIFDIYENSAYDIQQELKEKHPNLNLVVLIGSVRDSKRINSVFAEYKPDICYHAAAHKHVPLMEDSPCESIKNNAIGTYKTAYAAMVNGCRRFVLVSTDKAVNPTNIMGASKRLCEMSVQCIDRMIRDGRAAELPMLHAHMEDEAGTMQEFARLKGPVCTEFVAVRFGNVLGSNGSVIPIFKKQIAKGGPVTVTHPDIIRYFMTIPEAVSLILQAGSYAKGGEIFVLDMGEPVKIDTLARNLIKLSGLRPDVDIKISYVGLRPGEKLYEEKLMDEEGMRTTPNKLIHIGSPIPFDPDLFLRQLQELMAAAYREDPNIKDLVAQVVPTYHPGTSGDASKAVGAEVGERTSVPAGTPA